MAQRVAAEKRQPGDQRRGGADNGVGGIDHRFGKIAVVGNAEIELRERQVEAHAASGMAQQRLGGAGRLAQQVIEAALDEACRDQTLKPLCSATTPAVRL